MTGAEAEMNQPTEEQPSAAPSTAANEQQQQPSDKTEEEEKAWPPLSPEDHRFYNSMSAKMDQVHNYFRASWNELWNACQSGKRPRHKSLSEFLSGGLQFTEHLEAHHNIEERFFFPMLAAKMPEFRPDNGPMVEQHKVIHAGLAELQTYLRDCKRGKADFELRILKSKMEPWAEVLWQHLDEEVKNLRAENMRKYFTKAEFSRIMI